MVSYSKRGNTWQYAISHVVDGKSRPIRKSGFSNRKEAELAASLALLELNNGVLDPLKSYPFEKYFESWFKTFKTGITNISVNAYKATHNKIKAHFGDKTIQDISKREYQQFLNEMGFHYAKTTNRKMNGFIRSCIKEAIDEGIIKKDFTRGVTVTGAASKKASEKFINYEDSKKLLKHLAQDTTNIEYAMLAVALNTGVRYGELVGLTFDNVNIKAKTISIKKQWVYKEGDRFGELKNLSSERTIPVGSLTITFLKQAIKQSKSNPKNVHKLVFYQEDVPIQVVTNDRLNDVLRNCLNKLNITPLITVHGLRHTHASILLYKGVSVLYVSERLGHATIDITTSTYSHLIKELRNKDSKQTIEIFETILND